MSIGKHFSRQFIGCMKFSQILFYLCCATDICLHKYGPQSGIIFLFDMQHVRIGHLTRARIASVRKFFRYLQEAMPAKLCEIHVLNVVSFFDKILALIKPFMRAEIFKVVSRFDCLSILIGKSRMIAVNFPIPSTFTTSPEYTQVSLISLT